MSDRESLAYLYSLQRFGIKLGLENIRRLLSRAGEPQKELRLIHVAGTNGKGSVCSMLATLLTKAGHRTGLYTSPHLHDFNERIRVDGRLIRDHEMAELTDVLRRLCAEDIPATFFEFTTAMALCHFCRQQVEWGVLETGMGGRLDATNAVTPEVTIITSVAMDHAEHLGGTLRAVAVEKAGIMKPGVPVVSAHQPVEVADVLSARAAELDAPLYIYGQDFKVSLSHDGLHYAGLERDFEGLRLSLNGVHQHENLGVALAALEVAGVVTGMRNEAVASGVQGVEWPGRLEWWPGNRRILLDGAHNVAGCKALVSYLTQSGISKVRLVFGTKADKAAVDMLAELLPIAGELLLVSPPVEEAFPLETLALQSNKARVPVTQYSDVPAALDAGVSDLGDTVLVVAGSLFLVAAARERLGVIA